MLIFDQLKKDDPQLRFLATVVAIGMVVLLAGLWWMQVVSSRYYQERLDIQSSRTVRVPGARGNIYDREGRPLAENRPSYNIDLYLEDLSKSFQAAYSRAVKEVEKDLAANAAEEEKRLGRELTKKERVSFRIPYSMLTDLQRRARYSVSRDIVADLSARLGLDIPLEEKNFDRGYLRARALPFPVLVNLTPILVARFEEQSMHTPGLDLDIQSLRSYPNKSLAAHLLGYLSRNTESDEGEPASYNYRLDDYSGVSGLERLYDDELRGSAGGKSVLVNNLGYRQGETVFATPEPGENVYLTIDLDIQKVAETALSQAQANVKGAVVVMDVQNGDVLAMASAPTFDPNFFIQRPDPAIAAKEWERLNDPKIRPQINRAMQENYAPGSIFKILVGMAALEQNVFDPKDKFHSLGYYPMAGVRNGRIGDTAGPGDFNFTKALAKSSNPYFITLGLAPGVMPRVLTIGKHLHLGEKTDLIPGQEAAGHLPTLKDINASWWYQADSAYVSIGQGRISVTPLQMAVMVSAVANGGTVYSPRLVSKTVPYGSDEPSQLIPAARVRDNLGVSKHTIDVIHEAMLADVEDPNIDGTGKAAAVQGLRIAGKTGTAEVERNGRIDKSAKNTWFVSFAPYEHPKYAVVATVEGGSSGGGSCAPIARKIYEVIRDKELKRQNKAPPKNETMASLQ